jgi:hypothetical protein
VFSGAGPASDAIAPSIDRAGAPPIARDLTTAGRLSIAFTVAGSSLERSPSSETADWSAEICEASSPVAAR